MPKLLDSLFKIFPQADRGFVVMRPKADGPPVVVVDKSRRPGDEEKMRISRTIVEEAMKSKKAILSADAASDERFGMAQSIADFSIRSMICAPMIGLDGEADRRHPDRYAQPACAVYRSGPGSAGQRREPGGRRDRQRQDARAGRRPTGAAARSGARPPDATHAAALEAAASVRAISSSTTTRRPGKSAATITIMCRSRAAGMRSSSATSPAKASPPRLLMARLSADVRFSLASEPDPAKAVQQINEGFAHHDWGDRFVTMIAAVLNPAHERAHDA